MRKITLLVLTLGLMAGLLSSCARTYYVSSRPVEPHYARPASPYADAYWVPGEWEWRDGRYVYINGYWARPRGGHVYVAGHWQPIRHGYRWVHGHWR
jgi:hypothetical protein